VKVLLLNTDRGGSRKYRFQLPAAAITAAGEDIEIVQSGSIDVDAELDEFTGFTSVNEVTEEFDLIVIQRPLAQDLNALMLQAQAQGVAVAVELDDDFESIHKDNVSYHRVQPSHNKINNTQWLMATARQADMLIGSTSRIVQRYARDTQHGTVAPNYVAAVELERREQVRDTPGWTGTLQTHPTDLQVTGGAVGRLVDQFNTTFKVVGDSRGVKDALGISRNNQVTMTGWLPLEQYYDAIQDNIGVGIVPLEMSEFNHAKSWLQGIDYAALGIPFVASPTDEYRRLHSLGVGQLASTPTEWRQTMKRLLEDGRRRTTVGRRYRDIVRTNLTYESNYMLWVNAWRQAIANRKEEQ